MGICDFAYIESVQLILLCCASITATVTACAVRRHYHHQKLPSLPKNVQAFRFPFAKEYTKRNGLYIQLTHAQQIISSTLREGGAKEQWTEQ